VDHLGGCERILRTPLATVFSITARRFLFLYLLSLPFALLNKLRADWLTPVMTAAVAYALLALDQIGIELQQPFSPRSLSHPPLDDICRNLQRNLLALLAETRITAGNGRILGG
jgi:putative membrane protein